MGQRLSTETPVTCTICKQDEFVAGTTTVTLERGDTTVVVKSVPAGVQIEVRQFAAA